MQIGFNKMKQRFKPHLHSGPSCTGTAQEPFADADSHYNPMKCPHPFHAGDFPPLLGFRPESFRAAQRLSDAADYTAADHCTCITGRLCMKIIRLLMKNNGTASQYSAPGTGLRPVTSGSAGTDWIRSDT